MSIALLEARLIAASNRSSKRIWGFRQEYLTVWRPIRLPFRSIVTAASTEVEVPYRKQLKDEAKRRRATEKLGKHDLKIFDDAITAKWELTVGIEVHAQLNTERKLFSRICARSSPIWNTV